MPPPERTHPMKQPPPNRPLPYTDDKPVGAADFYFALHATFRFIEERLGREGLRAYWRELGSRYYAPVSAAWQKGGLPAVADYWRAFFQAEPGAEVEVTADSQRVTLEVRVCPAIKHLRAHGRKLIPCFCEHCYHVSEAMAAPAHLTVRVTGGNGSCRQDFLPRADTLPPQDLHAIKEAT